MAVNEKLLLAVLDEIRPNLQADGGDMEYHGVETASSPSSSPAIAPAAP